MLGMWQGVPGSVIGRNVLPRHFLLPGWGGPHGHLQAGNPPGQSSPLRRGGGAGGGWLLWTMVRVTAMLASPPQVTKCLWGTPCRSPLLLQPSLTNLASAGSPARSSSQHGCRMVVSLSPSTRIRLWAVYCKKGSSFSVMYLFSYSIVSVGAWVLLFTGLQFFAVKIYWMPRCGRWEPLQAGLLAFLSTASPEQSSFFLPFVFVESSLNK